MEPTTIFARNYINLLCFPGWLREISNTYCTMTYHQQIRTLSHEHESESLCTGPRPPCISPVWESRTPEEEREVKANFSVGSNRPTDSLPVPWESTSSRSAYFSCALWLMKNYIVAQKLLRCLNVASPSWVRKDRSRQRTTSLVRYKRSKLKQRCSIKHLLRVKWHSIHLPFIT